LSLAARSWMHSLIPRSEHQRMISAEAAGYSGSKTGQARTGSRSRFAGRDL
jgi:hypothetical protein